MRRILALTILTVALVGGIMTFIGNAMAGNDPPHSPFKCNEGPDESSVLCDPTYGG